MLNEISDRDIYKKPSYVVGITAYGDLYKQLENRFSERLWSLLHADFRSQSWLKRIEKLIFYILKAKALENQYSIDICIMTAMQTPELDAILDLPWEWSDPEVLDVCTYYHRGTLALGNERFSVVAVATGFQDGCICKSWHLNKLISFILDFW